MATDSQFKLRARIVRSYTPRGCNIFHPRPQQKQAQRANSQALLCTKKRKTHVIFLINRRVLKRWPPATSPITRLIIDTSAFLFVSFIHCGSFVPANGFLTFCRFGEYESIVKDAIVLILKLLVISFRLCVFRYKNKRRIIDGCEVGWYL